MKTRNKFIFEFKIFIIKNNIYCRICEKNKDSNCFGNNKRKINGKNNFCKECKKNIDKISYEKRSLKIKEQKLIKITQFRIDYEALKKDKCCKKCGENKYYLLDFHHINKEKDFNISAEAWRTLNINKIKIEIKKCIILCSNHHREFHFYEKKDGITITEYLNSTCF